jgi:hypothetical protein
MIFVALVVAIVGFIGSADAATLTLNWSDNSTNEDGFKVQRKVGSSGTYADLATVGKDVKTYVDSAVQEGVTYCYHVNAYNPAGSSAWSNEACAAPPFTIPAAPSQLGLTPGP